MAINTSKGTVRFAPFELDLRSGELRKDGAKPVRLPEQPFRILIMLLEDPGKVVSREEIRKKLWPNDTIVEFEHSISAAMNRLRQALGDSADNPRYIETLARRGYRLMVAVEWVGEQPDAQGAEVTAGAEAQTSGKASLTGKKVSHYRVLELLGGGGMGVVSNAPQPGAKSRWLVLAFCASVALLLVAAGWIFLSRHRDQHLPMPRVVPFTGLSGEEDQAAFSPDGNQLAFASQAGTGDAWHIYVKLIGAGTPLRLTNSAKSDFAPAWSPDGRYIAFARDSDQGYDVVSVPSLGGAERQLRHADTGPYLGARNLAWSPDGKLIAVLDRASSKGPFRIYFVTVANLEEREFASPPAGYLADTNPAFSPDGQTLAFTRWPDTTVGDIYLQPVAGGEATRLTSGDKTIAGLAWTADGRSIVYSANYAGLSTLWRVPISGGEPEPLPGIGPDALSPAVSPRGNFLAYTQSLWNINIWRAKGPRSTAAGGLPVDLISSSRTQADEQFSPDGKRVVFSSDRSGSGEIWVCNSDGSSPVQLTSFGGTWAGTPHWSPDGRWIAFDSRQGGKAGVFVVSAEGGEPRRLTEGNWDDIVPSWSQDGKWIYFCSNRSGDWELWKVPAAGGQALRLTQNGGFEAKESKDGKWIYYSKFSEQGIWKMPTQGGNGTMVLNRNSGRFWDLTDQGICFVDLAAKPHATINVHNFDTQRVTRIGTLDKEPPIGSYGALAVSPDGQWVLYPQVDHEESHIMLVENFR